MRRLPLVFVLVLGCADVEFRYPLMLAPGGAFITYVQPTGCEGCDALRRRDLIQTIDGEQANSAGAIAALNIADGKPHEVAFKRSSHGKVFDAKVTITAAPNDTMAPLVDAPPFWTVDAAKLDKAPEAWARRRLFGHASPALLLVDLEGQFINGRDLYGRKWLMVFFDWTSPGDDINGAIALKVMQLAKPKLDAAGVEMMLVQLQHFAEQPKPPMTNSDLYKFFALNQVSENEGGPLPAPPMYRSPNETEDDPGQHLGLEGWFGYLENLGETPNVLVLDEFGVICWHSAGPIPGNSGDEDMLEVMAQAVEFAIELDQPAAARSRPRAARTR